MSFFLPTGVATPLLKVPLLLGHAVCTYLGMSPPSVPPLPEDRRLSAPDVFNWMRHAQRGFIRTAKTVLCGLAIAEAVTLLAQRSMPTSLLHRAAATLLDSVNVRLDTLPLQLTPASVVACLFGISGGLMRWWCYRTLGRLFTWDVGIQKDHQLVTSGPYKIVRHPSYTGGFLMITGNFALLLSAGSFFTESGLRGTWSGKVVAAAIIAYLSWLCAGLLYRTKTEDEMLKGEFGEEWNKWAEKTPYQIIPFLF